MASDKVWFAGQEPTREGLPARMWVPGCSCGDWDYNHAYFERLEKNHDAFMKGVHGRHWFPDAEEKMTINETTIPTPPPGFVCFGSHNCLMCGAMYCFHFFKSGDPMPVCEMCDDGASKSKRVKQEQD